MPSPNIENAAVGYKHHNYLLQILIGKIIYGSRNVFLLLDEDSQWCVLLQGQE